MRRHYLRTSQATVAMLLAALVLFLEAMAVCPSLHELIHKDADSPGHQCAVTLFAHGAVDSAVVEIATPAPASLTFAFQSVVISPFSPAIAELPAGRAPPVASSQS